MISLYDFCKMVQIANVISKVHPHYTSYLESIIMATDYKALRLKKGTRLLDPKTGTYFKQGGKFVKFVRWTETGHVIVKKGSTYYLVDPGSVGYEKKQGSLFSLGG